MELHKVGENRRALRTPSALLSSPCSPPTYLRREAIGHPQGYRSHEGEGGGTDAGTSDIGPCACTCTHETKAEREILRSISIAFEQGEEALIVGGDGDIDGRQRWVLLCERVEDNTRRT